MRDVVIVAAKRTAIGSFGGAFKDVSAVELGKVAVEAVIKDINLDVNEVDEVIFGNVLKAGLGQNVARQVSVLAGLPEGVPSFVVDKVCGSGLKAIQLAVQAIKVGDADVVIAGGTESMSQAAYVAPGARWGLRMGNGQLVDTMVNDGLTDAFKGYHMGVTAENIVEKYGFTREQQDNLAMVSQNRAEVAVKTGVFKGEIAPVIIPQRKGDPKVVDTDEYPKAGTTMETLGKLRPAFKKDGGSVTAGNASGINDGAAAVVVMSKEKADKLGLKALVTIKSYASAGVDPSIMGTGPIPAVKKALAKASLEVKDLDLVEANEAFASQALSVITDLGLNTDVVNVNGGAIALGHPIGASGARIFVTLVHELQKREEAKLGLATLCIGGGQGIAVVVEKE